MSTMRRKLLQSILEGRQERLEQAFKPATDIPTLLSHVVNGTVCFLFVFLAFSLADAQVANAARISFILQGDKGAIKLEGRVVRGDFEKFMQIKNAARRAIVLVFLDSDGGDILETRKIAKEIYLLQVGTVVDYERQCLSACLLLFIAGTPKIVTPTSTIGGHRISEAKGKVNREENALTDEMNAWYLDVLQAFGVPASLTDKLSSTSPSKMYYLTREDLKSMGVIIQP
jgi:hypothetical protein